MTEQEYWDDLFANEKQLFGEMSPMAEACLAYVNSGIVLDIGAGQGRNCIPFAQKGLTVKAIDVSDVAMEQLRCRANQEGLPISTQVANVAGWSIEGDYDVIICAFMLHCLAPEEAMSLLIGMQNHTKQNGFNVVSLFMDRGYLYNQDDKKKSFYIHEGELIALYSDWHIIESVEENTKTRGDYNNMVAEILARKPR